MELQWGVIITQLGGGLTFQLESDIIEIYRRLNTLSRRIARLSVDATMAAASEIDPET